MFRGRAVFHISIQKLPSENMPSIRMHTNHFSNMPFIRLMLVLDLCVSQAFIQKRIT
jgi:hypothetical protein